MGIVIKCPESYIEIAETKDIQKILYHMVKRFHEICAENGIFYVAFGGTMLGAVRHQGMIPWDDDVDVSMRLSDIEKLKAVIADKYSNEFEIFDYGDPGYFYHFAKLGLKRTVLYENVMSKYSKLAAFIDLFPIYGYPLEKEEEFFCQIRKLREKIVNSVSVERASPVWWKKPGVAVKWFIHLPDKMRGFKRPLDKEVELLKSNSFEESKIVLLQGTAWCQKGRLVKEKLFDRQLYKFGEGEIFGIRDYDEHLRNLYGNYLELPPVEKRCPHHDYHLYIEKGLWEELNNEKE